VTAAGDGGPALAPTRGFDAAGAPDATEGDLGGAVAPSPTPARHALAVAIGQLHACVLRDGHSVKCWSSTWSTDGPPQHAVQIAAGGDDTCAILEDGTVTCWGLAWSVAHYSPALGLGRRAVSLAMTDRPWACAVLDDGTATCWAEYLSNGPSPTTTPLPLPPSSAPIRQLGISALYFPIALYEDGTIGEGVDRMLTPGRLFEDAQATTLANVRGGTSWCAALEGGGVHCWDFFPAPTGRQILTQLAMTSANLCGLRPNGTVSCRREMGLRPECEPGAASPAYWCRSGMNPDGSYDVALGQRAIAVATGTALSAVACAVLVDGSVKCWSLSDSSGCAGTINGICPSDAIVGKGVEVTKTASGADEVKWRAIDFRRAPLNQAPNRTR
jgi:hypothetical protein